MIDFNQFGKSTKNNNQTGETTVTPTAPIPSVTPTTTTKSKINFNQFGKSGNVAYTPKEETKPGWASEMVKDIVRMPATMLARPVQLAAELIMPGDNTEAIDRFSREKLGGIVAPVPQNAADVKKDVGRAIGTVALGMSPISGGAAFGVGGSLEQGNDLFSLQTALQGSIGALAAPLIGKIGAPILNAAGKVVGKITGPYLKQLASKGTGAVEKWMAEQELLGGIAKGVSEKITAGSKSFDTGTEKLFSSAKNKAGEVITTWQPGLSKDNMTKRFEKIEQDNLIKPTKQSGATFRDATKIYNDAKAQGYDLGEVATNNKIYDKDLISDGKYNTVDAVSALRQETASKGPDILRPALKEAELGVQKVPVSTIRDEMRAEINSISNSKITAADRQKMLNAVEKTYGVNSPEALAHPDGYSLTNFYDNKIANAGKVTKGGFAAPLNAPTKTANTYYKSQASVFRKNFLKHTPKELGADAFEKKLQERFMLADYLEKLNGKKAPTSLFQGALRTGAKVSGAALGGSTGNVFGAFGGYHAGGMAMDSFMNASNPVKSAYLKEVQALEPEIFNAIREYIGDQQISRLMRLKLTAPKSTSAPDLMNMQNERGAVEMGHTAKPITPGEKMTNDIQQNTRIFSNTPQLKAPEQRFIIENKGTPNQPGIDYGTNREPGGMYQRIFEAKTSYPISKKAAELTKKNGGVTINLKGDVPEKGFAYSPYKDSETVIPEIKFTDSDIDNFVEKYYDRLNLEGNHLGSWVDDGKVYIDISKVNPDENAAVIDSLQNNQIGLFDLSNFETKYIKDYEKIGSTYIHKRKN